MTPLPRAATWLVALSVTFTAGPARAQTIDPGAVRAYLVAGFEANKAMDLAFAEAIPDSALHWAPSEGVRHFAGQVYHTVDNSWLAGGLFGEDRPAFVNDSSNAVNDKAALATFVSDAYAWVTGKLNVTTDQELSEEVNFFGQSMARWRAYAIVLQHAEWTRGQLVPYFHAHGVSVPGWKQY